MKRLDGSAMAGRVLVPLEDPGPWQTADGSYLPGAERSSGDVWLVRLPSLRVRDLARAAAA